MAFVNVISVLLILASLFLMPLAREARAGAGFNGLYQGARAEAMGNAFVGLADDEEAIFLNPAGMAGITGSKLTFASEQAEMSTDTVANLAGGSSALTGSFSASTLNAYMGKNFYLSSEFAPSFVMPHFGIAILVNDQLALNIQNPALPSLQVGQQFTNGVQFAYGTSVLPRYVTSSDLRVGVGGNLMWRSGGYQSLSFDQILALASGGAASLRSLIGGNYGMGYDFDLGVQYIYHFLPGFDVQAGAVSTQIGGESFAGGGNIQKGNTALGLTGIYRAPFGRIILSYDYQHILDDIDPLKRNHFGLGLEFPMISV